MNLSFLFTIMVGHNELPSYITRLSQCITQQLYMTQPEYILPYNHPIPLIPHLPGISHSQPKPNFTHSLTHPLPRASTPTLSNPFQFPSEYTSHNQVPPPTPTSPSLPLATTIIVVINGGGYTHTAHKIHTLSRKSPSPSPSLIFSSSPSLLARAH